MPTPTSPGGSPPGPRRRSGTSSAAGTRASRSARSTAAAGARWRAGLRYGATGPRWRRPCAATRSATGRLGRTRHGWRCGSRSPACWGTSERQDRDVVVPPGVPHGGDHLGEPGEQVLVTGEGAAGPGQPPDPGVDVLVAALDQTVGVADQQVTLAERDRDRRPVAPAGAEQQPRLVLDDLDAA